MFSDARNCDNFFLEISWTIRSIRLWLLLWSGTLLRNRKKLFESKYQILNRFWVSNTSAFFQKFHNVDSERLFGSFSLHFLSESHPFWNAPQTAPGAQSRASCLFCVTNTPITTWNYPLRVTSSNSQALFRCPSQSGEHPTGTSTWWETLILILSQVLCQNLLIWGFG